MVWLGGRLVRGLVFALPSDRHACHTLNCMLIDHFIRGWQNSPKVDWNLIFLPLSERYFFVLFIFFCVCGVYAVSWVWSTTTTMHIRWQSWWCGWQWWQQPWFGFICHSTPGLLRVVFAIVIREWITQVSLCPPTPLPCPSFILHWILICRQRLKAGLAAR